LNEAVLQVLLILAFLAIGLISVTFPVYAISVNFLPKQKWEDEKGRKKRMDNLEAKIKELTGRLGSGDANTETIKEQLDQYKAEKEGTELRYNYLTAVGAVLTPVIALIFALLFAVVGIYTFYKDLLGVTIVMGSGSGIFSLAAISSLYKTISAVEYGALRPERTVWFNVGFGLKNEKRISIQLGKRTEATLFVDTPESEVENLYIQVNFPAELEAWAASLPNVITMTKHETYTVICQTTGYLPKGRNTGFLLSMTPKRKGEYTVKALVYAKGIYEYSEDLTIEVV
jgi:hypothetical protein